MVAKQVSYVVRKCIKNLKCIIKRIQKEIVIIA